MHFSFADVSVSLFARPSVRSVAVLLLFSSLSREVCIRILRNMGSGGGFMLCITVPLLEGAKLLG